MGDRSSSCSELNERAASQALFRLQRSLAKMESALC
jgi:hypothetical protein